jgi:hypothetical protein
MSAKLDEETKQKLIREMPEDFLFLYDYAKEHMGIDLWDALED